jgi:hypothetical protein
MGVSVSVGVMLGVKVSEGLGLRVGVWVVEGVNVLVEVRVNVGVRVSVRVGVGLMKMARTVGFDESSQPPMRIIPKTRLNTQNPMTTLPKEFDEDFGITLSPVRFCAGYQAPC